MPTDPELERLRADVSKLASAVVDLSIVVADLARGKPKPSAVSNATDAGNSANEVRHANR